MRGLISAALTSCRTLHNLKRMTAIRSSVLISRSPFATTAASRCASSSSDKDKSNEKTVSVAGARPSAVQRDSEAKQQQQEEQLEEVADVILKEIPDSRIHWEYQQSSEAARVYDKKPIRIKCKEGRMYMWCSCGNSRSQPFCDGTHRHVQFGTTLKPVPWACKKTGYYWFCNCKKTGKKVFCDGTHLQLMQDPNVTPIIKH